MLDCRIQEQEWKACNVDWVRDFKRLHIMNCYFILFASHIMSKSHTDICFILLVAVIIMKRISFRIIGNKMHPTRTMISLLNLTSYAWSSNQQAHFFHKQICLQSFRSIILIVSFCFSDKLPSTSFYNWQSRTDFHVHRPHFQFPGFDSRQRSCLPQTLTGQ